MKSKYQCRVFILIALVAFLTGCSRYEHVPKAPTEKRVISIDITTKQPPTADFYYYIAFETETPDGDEIGPRAILEGEDRAEDWTYYILFYDGRFEEKVIITEADRDDIPDLFDNSSERFYSASQTGSTISVEVYIDKIVDPTTGKVFTTIPGKILLNFITGTGPISETEEASITVIDNLLTPFLTVQTSPVGYLYESQDFQNIDTLDVAETANQPADIDTWVVVIDEKSI